MAKITFYRDDFDGTEDSTVQPRTVRLEEGTLSIDLSKDNYGKLMDALSPFMDKGEWAPRETGTDENTLIREWARKNRLDVSPRGRIPADIVAKYLEATKSSPEPTQPAGDVNAEDTDNAEDNSTEDNGSREPATAGHAG